MCSVFGTKENREIGFMSVLCDGTHCMRSVRVLQWRTRTAFFIIIFIVHLLLSAASAGEGGSAGLKPLIRKTTDSRSSPAPDTFGALTLRLRMKDGTAVEEVLVEFESLSRAKWRRTTWRPVRGRLGYTRIKDDQEIQLVEGDWIIRTVPRVSHPYVGTVGVAIRPGENTRETLTIQEIVLVEIPVIVTSQEGQPLHQVYLDGHTAKHPTLTSEAVTNAGRAKLRVPRDHRMVLKVHTLPSVPYHDKQMVIKPSATTQEPLAITLQQKQLTAWYKARFIEDGKVVPIEVHKPSERKLGLEVEFRRTDATRLMETFVEDGRIQFWGLRPGKYKILYLWYPRMDQRKVYRCPPVDQTVFKIPYRADTPMFLGDIVFHRWPPGQCTLSGEVHDIVAEARDGLRVEAHRISRDGEASDDIHVTLTDAQGKFSLTKLESGRYELVVRNGGRVCGRRPDVVAEPRSASHVRIRCTE
jgi:hypothetical protein